VYSHGPQGDRSPDRKKDRAATSATSVAVVVVAACGNWRSAVVAVAVSVGNTSFQWPGEEEDAKDDAREETLSCTSSRPLLLPASGDASMRRRRDPPPLKTPSTAMTMTATMSTVIMTQHCFLRIDFW